MDEQEIKIKLHGLCLKIVEERIREAKGGMEMLQAAANQETKSSAGDKYETGRAMMQLEQDKIARQLMESMKLKKVLDQLNPAKDCSVVQQGCLIFSSNGNFYISSGIGKLELEGKEYMAISAASPLARQMEGLKAGDEAGFNGRMYRIIKMV